MKNERFRGLAQLPAAGLVVVMGCTAGGAAARFAREIESIPEELTDVRRQLRWLKLYAVGSTIVLAAIVTATLQRAPDRNRLFECSIDPAGFVMYDNDGNEMGGLGVVDIERGQGATLAVNPRLPEL